MHTEEKRQACEQEMIVAAAQMTVGIDSDCSDYGSAYKVSFRRKAHDARYSGSRSIGDAARRLFELSRHLKNSSARYTVVREIAQGGIGVR